MAKEPKKDKLAWRGDADEYDTDMKGPGHVPEGSGKWDSYNWASQQTGAWWNQTEDNRKQKD
jgi:hypothetical protein